MFILLSKSYLIFNQSVLENEANEDNYVLIYNLKYDSTVPIKLKWPNNSVSSTDEKMKSTATRCNVICGCFSQSEDYFAFCDDNKNLIIFNRDFEPIDRFVVKRNCVKIEFNKNEDTIFGCDKSGDIYEFNFKRNDNQEKLLLGHCSMLLDFILTRDQKYIISCDRDEKIRVTNYPNTYNIMSYCLGHSEFVQTIKQLDDYTLVSGSGDGKLILWNFLQGKSLFIYQCDQIDIQKEQQTKDGQSKYAIKSITIDQTNANYLAVSFFNQATVYLFQVVRDNNQVIASLDLIEKLVVEFEPNWIRFDLCHTNYLWIVGAFEHKPIELFELKQNKLLLSFSNVKIVDCLNENIKLAQVFANERQMNQVNNLFKHYYNNVELYYQRKQLREEGCRIKKRHLSD